MVLVITSSYIFVTAYELNQGSQPLWKSGKTLKMSFQFSRQGKLREFWKNTKNQGKLREFDSDPERYH